MVFPHQMAWSSSSKSFWIFARNMLEVKKEASTRCSRMVCFNLFPTNCSCHSPLFGKNLLLHWLSWQLMHRIILLVQSNLQYLGSLWSQCLLPIWISGWTCGTHPLLLLVLQKWDQTHLEPHRQLLHQCPSNGFKYELPLFCMIFGSANPTRIYLS